LKAVLKAADELVTSERARLELELAIRAARGPQSGVEPVFEGAIIKNMVENNR
jgi:hypothetical protein